jgi:hypothetical protein
MIIVISRPQSTEIVIARVWDVVEVLLFGN